MFKIIHFLELSFIKIYFRLFSPIFSCFNFIGAWLVFFVFFYLLPEFNDFRLDTFFTFKYFLLLWG